jgi:competence protein ComEC
VLAGLVAGLLAGPRWPGATVALTLALGGGAAVAARVAIARAAGVVGGAGTAGVGPSVHDMRELEGPPPLGRLAALLSVAAVAVLLGAVVADARLAALDRTVLRPHDGATVRGFVVEAPRTRARGVRVAPVRLGGAGERVLVRAEPRTRWPRVRVGDEVEARGELRALEGWEGFERRRNVHAVLEADRVIATGRSRGSPLDAARRRAEDALGAGLRPEQAALARGMVLGQDHALSEDLRDAFRASGLSHLVAASGTNVMLLAGLVLGIASILGIGLRARLGIALVAVALYVPIAGAGPSIQRAGVMGAAGLVAALAGRPAMRWYAVLLAATGTLALNPRAAEDPGWQLSFAAVIAILGLHARMAGALTDRGVARPVADATALTVAATAGTAPLLALHFEQLSLVSLPANLLAAPAVAPVMWLGAGACLLGGPAAEALNFAAAFPLAYLAWLARAAATVPGANVAVGLPGPLAAVVAYALLVVVAAGLVRAGRRLEGRARPRRATVAASGVAVLGALALAVPAPPGPPAGFVVSALDVGQGDAILLQDGPRAILVDTGPPGAPLLRELRAAGVRRLDAVLVTHSSADHEGGLAALLAAVPVGFVLDGRGPGREHGGEGGGARFTDVPASMPRDVPAAGQRLRAGRIRLDVLWPPPDDARTGDPNATATVRSRGWPRERLLTATPSPSTLPLTCPTWTC